MVTAAAPTGVVLEVPARAADSPSQERLGRIAALLRDAEMSAHPSAHGRTARRRSRAPKH